MRLVLAVMLGLAMPGAWASETPPATATTEPKPDLDEVVCRRMPAPTGSHLGSQTVCQTRKHWQELEQGSKDELERIQAGSNRGAGEGH